ncbi:MAG: hypothetical protein AAFQ21_11180, partial [Pseudomonadota bacterium]
LAPTTAANFERMAALHPTAPPPQDPMSTAKPQGAGDEDHKGRWEGADKVFQRPMAAAFLGLCVYEGLRSGLGLARFPVVPLFAIVVILGVVGGLG